jgi:4-amino-4-deoxy-L-arabinose transferase-like glycosyltransferase
MNKLTHTQRRWLLSVHLFFVSILFGVTVCFLVLSIIAATTDDGNVFKACYTSMHMLAKTSVRASTIGTVVTGILLSVLTNWGLFRFRWIIVKEILTILSIGLGVVGMYFWTLKAASIASVEGLNALHSPTFTVNNFQLWVGILLQIIFLAAMFVISIFKPWGPRKQRTKT